MKKIALKPTQVEQLLAKGTVALATKLEPQPPRAVFKEGKELWGTVEDEHGGSHGDFQRTWTHPIGPEGTELMLVYPVEGDALLVLPEEVLDANPRYPVHEAKHVILTGTAVVQFKDGWHWVDQLDLKEQ